MDILIFGGQSNMQGQTECLSDSSVVPGAYEYKWLSDSFAPLCNPVGENITYGKTEGFTALPGMDGNYWRSNHVLGASCYGHTNMVPKFCESYIRETGAQVAAVHAAKGATVVGQWLPGTPGYEMLVEKAQGAIKKVQAEGKVGHIYFAWLQGESDAIEGHSKEEYKAQLRQLREALEADLGIEAFGIIRVGRFIGMERDQEIISAQDELSEEEGFLMLTRIALELNDIPEYMNPEVSGHYSAKGQEKLGEEAGAALGRWSAARMEKGTAGCVR